MTKRDRISSKMKEQVQHFEDLVDRTIADPRKENYLVAVSFWCAAKKMHRIFLEESRGG